MRARGAWVWNAATAASNASDVVVFHLPASHAPVKKETSSVMVAPCSLDSGGRSQRRKGAGAAFTYMPSSRGKVSVIAGI